jgi:alpha/beta superfamily hydrolase
MTTQSRLKADPNPATTALVAGVQSRYVDAYRVASTMAGFGNTIKLAGFIFGAWIFFWAVGSLESPGLGAVAAFVIGAIFVVIGIIVDAQGQMLKAALDTAVNSSPFLNNGQKAAAMSLPGASHALGSAEQVAEAQKLERAEQMIKVSDEEVVTPFCYHCGTELAMGAQICPACGKQL